MGQSQAIPTNISSAQRDANFHETDSGVRITGDLAHDIESKIQRAYNIGRDEGKNEFVGTFAQIAAQAQENLREQLTNIQDDSINKSVKLAEDLREKFKAPKFIQSFCVAEESALTECLKKNCDNPLECDQLARKYTMCSISNK